MSIQATINISSELDSAGKDLDAQAKEVLQDVMERMARDVTRLSPVQTGAYVTSHSFQTNTSSRGRRKTSAGKPIAPNKDEKREEGYRLLLQDIDTLDLNGLTKITLRNDSTHAQSVELKHIVYSTVRNLYG